MSLGTIMLLNSVAFAASTPIPCCPPPQNGTVISFPVYATTPVVPIGDPYVYVGGQNVPNVPAPTTPATPVAGKASLVASNSTIKCGTAFDVMKGVKATDIDGKNITNKVTASGSINTTVAGKYKITYKVTLANGKIMTKTVTVTVECSCVPAPVSCTSAPVSCTSCTSAAPASP